MPSCLTLSNIRYVSRAKLSNSGKGIAPSPTFRCSRYWKGSLQVALDYGRQLYFLLMCSLVFQFKVSYSRICCIPFLLLKFQLNNIFIGLIYSLFHYILRSFQVFYFHFVGYQHLSALLLFPWIFAKRLHLRRYLLKFTNLLRSKLVSVHFVYSWHMC